MVLAWAEDNALSLSAVHLKGEKNAVADFLSRRAQRESDWVLNREIFNLIAMRWGLPDVDLFASKENAKAPLFSLKQVGGCPWGRCPDAELALFKVLCPPPTSLAASGSEKISGREYLPDPGGTTLAQKALVLGSETTSGGTPMAVASPGGPSLAGPGILFPGGMVEPLCLATEEDLLKSKGFSERLVSTLLGSRKETRLIYRKVWRRFNDRC